MTTPRTILLLSPWLLWVVPASRGGQEQAKWHAKPTVIEYRLVGDRGEEGWEATFGGGGKSTTLLRPKDDWWQFGTSLDLTKAGITMPGKYTLRLVKSAEPSAEEAKQKEWHGDLTSNALQIEIHAPSAKRPQQ